jgi:uncharacterized metal-binding protein YceD (DUF177 family)
MTKGIPATNVWSVPIAAADVPETGRRVDLVADATTRDAIAKIAGVAALPRLQVEFDLTQHGDGGLRVTGRVCATVEQACVVTLEPIQNEIDEAVDLVFMPEPAAEAAGVARAAVAAADGADVDEALETMHDGKVDLGAIAVEFLLLGIDPYPRKPGAVFDAPPTGDPAGHPFAALAALKKSESSKDQ